MNKTKVELAKWARTAVGAIVFSFLTSVGVIAFFAVVKITGMIMGVM